MIIDLTTGFNELDLFAIRYHELEDIVDKFIIIEATHTHSGLPKPFYFSDWKNGVTTHNGITFRNAFDANKIDIYGWDNSGYPNDNAGAWLRENVQRELLLNAVGHYPDDTIALLSDMDEIPRASTLEQWLHAVGEQLVDSNNVWRFEQSLSYLYFNTTAGNWHGTKIFPLSVPRNSTLERPMTHGIRYLPEHQFGGTIQNGGWHFSSCGGLERVRTKFDSYAHTEMQLKTTDDIDDSLQRLVDPFHKNPLTLQLMQFLPEYVQKNIDYFRSQGYIYDFS